MRWIFIMEFLSSLECTCGSWEYCCGDAVDLGSNTAPDLGSNTDSNPGKLAIDDGGGTLANWLNVGIAPAKVNLKWSIKQI